MSDLTFKKLRDVNSERSLEWSKGKRWEASDFFNELNEEIGEICKALKRLKRIECGMVGVNPEDKEYWQNNLKEEFGDVQIVLDLWAESLGVDLGEVTKDKFNKISDKHGFIHKL